MTWLGLAEDGGFTGTTTFQLAIFASGEIEYRWLSCQVSSHLTLVGWSPGGGARNPGNVDLSTALPLVTASDRVPLGLVADARPIVGTDALLRVVDVPSTTLLGAFIGGTAAALPGNSLAAIGMPDCFRHVRLDANVPFFVSGNDPTLTWSVPNDPGLTGVSLFFQAAALVPGANAANALSSNAIEMRIGTQ